jgi:hypothetical protein
MNSEKEFLRNFEKEIKNLLTKNKKCEILHLLTEMSEIIVQIRKGLDRGVY